MKVYYVCPDHNTPIGGIKQIYRHVDILNQSGLPAAILHQQEGFRCTWFDNNTEVACYTNTAVEITDFLVIPENCGPDVVGCVRGPKKVVFNQNSYNTFLGYSIEKNDLATPYLDSEFIAAMVVSEDNKEYLQHVFPELEIFRIHNGIDLNVFKYQGDKKCQIAFMPRKHADEVQQVINMLKFRGVLGDYDMTIIEGKSEAEVAAILKESLIFLSFGYPEGSPLPPAEAMACGCIVIGYDGMGGREYFKPEFSYPVLQANTLEFAKTVEEVINIYQRNPEILREKAEKASAFIGANYSLARERSDIIETWINIIENSLVKTG